MRISARGSVLFCLATAFIAVLFYFQPAAEAKAAFTEATNLQENISQEVGQSNFQPENQTQNLIKESVKSAANALLSEARSFRATAYCLQGRTASGGGVRRGVVAADPRVLPLGTRIQVSAGAYSGTYTVADTGGVIKGRILDIWVPTCAEAIRFGRKTISVSVVGAKKSKSNS
jgi:3D (Asp-Asp-Asp) domain-containing protein